MKQMLIGIWALLAVTGSAQPTVVGQWTGSGGWVYKIPTQSGSFNLEVIGLKGERRNYNARWDRPGEVFFWTDSQKAKHTAVFEQEHRPPRIRDVGENYPDSPGYWYRKDH